MKKVKEIGFGEFDIKIPNSLECEENRINIGNESNFDPKIAFHYVNYIEKNNHLKIGRLIDFLRKSTEMGAEYIEIKWDIEEERDGGFSLNSIILCPFKERDETKEEEELRTAKENEIMAERKKEQEALEFNQYLKLKEKYGNA